MDDVVETRLGCHHSCRLFLNQTPESLSHLGTHAPTAAICYLQSMEAQPRLQAPPARDTNNIPSSLYLQQHQDKQSRSWPSDGISFYSKWPESLPLVLSSLRTRSPTSSTTSSISSAHIPDSATAFSPSTLESPLIYSATSDVRQRFVRHSLDVSRPPRSTCHRRRPSTATCSTHSSDVDDGLVFVDCLNVASKIPEADKNCLERIETREIYGEEELSTHPTPVEEEDDDALTSDKGNVLEQHRAPCSSPTQKLDVSFSTFGDAVSPGDADEVLIHTSKTAYGIELGEVRASTGSLHQAVSNFIRNLGQHIWHAPLDTQTSQTTFVSISSATPPNRQGGGNCGHLGKRKKQQTNGDGSEEELSDGEGSRYNPSKRLKPSPRDDENLRLSCPYRKRNPQRFNVRDHHSCAMTYFPKFAELRQHIVKQHTRDDPSAFVCDRCTRDFGTRKELREHQRQPKEQMCDISDHDPEAGIDGPTSNKLLSRKRVSGTSPKVQWREIWSILFPDDDDSLVGPYYYTPVIEHFELSTHYLEALQYLQSTLRDEISNHAGLETLATQFHHCFFETVERCVQAAQSMPYTNRSNRRQETPRAQSRHSLSRRTPRVATSRPDSAVVVDDITAESASIMGLLPARRRDSVRMTTSSATRRESSLGPRAHAGVFDVAAATPSSLSQPVAASPDLHFGVSNMDLANATAAAVEQWTEGLSFNQQDGASLPEQWMVYGSVMPQEAFSGLDEPLLYHMDYGAMGEPMAGFHGKTIDGTP